MTRRARPPSRRLTLLAAVVVSLLASGCYTMRASLPGALRGDLDDEEVIIVGRVDREVSHLYLLGGLLNPPPRELLEAELRPAVQEAGADGVANLVFEARFTAFDVVVWGLSLGLVSPRTYRIRADLVRIRAPPIPGRPLSGGLPSSGGFPSSRGSSADRKEQP